MPYSLSSDALLIIVSLAGHRNRTSSLAEALALTQHEGTEAYPRPPGSPQGEASSFKVF